MDRGITIDAKTSKDLDDAISLSRLDDGTLVAKVYVTDVASYVPDGHSYDGPAFEKLETRYYSGGSNPMLSSALAEGKLSLLEGKQRKAIRILVKLKGLEVTETSVDHVEFKSRAKLAHGDVPAILSDPSHELHEEMSLFADLAKGLLAQRRDRGALLIYDLTKGLVTDEEGNLVRMPNREDTIGYIIVQEMMILANAELAKWVAKKDLPVIFRNHAARSSAPPREDLLEQLDRVSGAIEMFAQQTGLMFQPATYDGHITGHFGLNLPAYLHATSPIRRYVDLVNQRQILAKLKEDELPYSSDDITVMAKDITERLAERKDRKSEAMKKRANHQAESISDDEGRLHSAPDKEFERVVKVVCRSTEDCPEAVLNSFHSRLRQDRVPDIVLLTVLAESDLTNNSFDPLRKLAIAQLTDYPYKATSVHHMGVQSEFWDDVETEITRTGPDHAPRFRCSAGPVESEASGKKLSEQRAFASLLALRADVESPVWDAPEEDAPKTPKRIKLEKPGDNPVGQLLEFCQKNNIDPPTYEYKQFGPDHAPIFECIGKACGKSVGVKSGGSKKSAKKIAAEALINEVKHELQHSPA